jgi:hypothetical protein
VDLERVRNIAAAWKEDAAESDGTVEHNVAQCLNFLESEFPAFPDSDKAAVAWFASQLLAYLGTVAVSTIGATLDTSAEAYAVTTVKLLGWDE